LSSSFRISLTSFEFPTLLYGFLSSYYDGLSGEPKPFALESANCNLLYGEGNALFSAEV